MNWWKKKRKSITQRGDVVLGDQAGRDITKQTIIGDNNIATSGYLHIHGDTSPEENVSTVIGSSITKSPGGISIMSRDGNVTIKGPVKTLNVNGKVWDFPHNVNEATDTRKSRQKRAENKV